MTMTISDISKHMKAIDFCMLASRAQDGSLGGRPMSNNQEVDYEGDSFFFSYNDTRMVEDIGRDASVGLTYSGSPAADMPKGAPGLFIHVEGEAKLIRDKDKFAKHWDKSLSRWFEQGVDTSGMIMIKVAAKRIHYWAGEDEGEVKVPDPAN